MTYAAFDHAMAYFWLYVYFPVLLWGLLWAVWVFTWSEPRKRRRLTREARDNARG